MTLWLDEQISPYLAQWIEEHFQVSCVSVTTLPVDRADDLAIFLAARDAGAVVMSKDSDFSELVRRLGTPPALIWLTFGNCSNAAMKEILSRRLGTALELLAGGESIVELS